MSDVDELLSEFGYKPEQILLGVGLSAYSFMDTPVAVLPECAYDGSLGCCPGCSAGEGRQVYSSEPGSHSSVGGSSHPAYLWDQIAKDVADGKALKGRSNRTRGDYGPLSSYWVFYADPANASVGELAFWNDYSDMDVFTSTVLQRGYAGVYTWVATSDAMDWRVHRHLHTSLQLDGGGDQAAMRAVAAMKTDDGAGSGHRPAAGGGACSSYALSQVRAATPAQRHAVAVAVPHGHAFNVSLALQASPCGTKLELGSPVQSSRHVHLKTDEMRVDHAIWPYPGWLFRAHGRPLKPGAGSAPSGRRQTIGYPPLPWAGFPTYNMAQSTAAWFVGNDTGLNSAVEIAAEARFGVVGIGWQLHMFGSGFQHLETWEALTARAIKRASPKTRVLVSRWAPEFGGRIGFPPPEMNELVLFVEMGCTDTVHFPREPNTPF